MNIGAPYRYITNCIPKMHAPELDIYCGGSNILRMNKDFSGKIHRFFNLMTKNKVSGIVFEDFNDNKIVLL